MANVEPKKFESEPPAFAFVKLKKVARPADYDGSQPNLNTNEAKSEESISSDPVPLYDVSKLKKTNQSSGDMA